MRLSEPVVARVLSCLLVAIPISCQSTVVAHTQGVTDIVQNPEHPVRPEQVREYLHLTGAGEIFRAGWISVADSMRAKAPPYWPESFWNDLRSEMMTADLVPTITEQYGRFISAELMQKVLEFLRTKSLKELTLTSLGAEFCDLQKRADEGHEAATLKLTQPIFERVYARHQTAIKAARVKYLAVHPDHKD